MKALIIVSRRSNSAIFVGWRPITRTAESPRPIPITIRPPEMSCSVAWALAVTAGSRVTGLVTHMPMFIVVGVRREQRDQRVRLLPEDRGVVGPARVEAELLGLDDELDQPLIRRVRQDGDAEAQHQFASAGSNSERLTKRPWPGWETTLPSS